MYTIACCLVVGLGYRVRVRTGVRIRFSVWLVSGYAYVGLYVLLWIVIATLPEEDRLQNDRNCVVWGIVKLYALVNSFPWSPRLSC